MQPAYYENLEEIQNKYWSMLDDAVINRNSSFRIPVFICSDQNEIDGRIVVLRKSDKNNNVLQFWILFKKKLKEIEKIDPRVTISTSSCNFQLNYLSFQISYRKSEICF